MTSQAPVLDRLRAATATAHRELEDQLDAVDRLATLAGKRAMVPRYYRMHQAAERAAWPVLRTVADLDIASRSRIDVRMRDLEALEVRKPEAAPPPDLAGGGAEALGLLYVLEGSTLGGRMIRGMLTARGGDLTGLSFLDPYGPRTGARWRAFLGVLEREADSDPAAAERGAIAGFRHAQTCLLEGVPA